jgi:hypothetical protein
MIIAGIEEPIRKSGHIFGLVLASRKVCEITNLPTTINRYAFVLMDEEKEQLGEIVGQLIDYFDHSAKAFVCWNKDGDKDIRARAKKGMREKEGAFVTTNVGSMSAAKNISSPITKWPIFESRPGDSGRFIVLLSDPNSNRDSDLNILVRETAEAISGWNMFYPSAEFLLFIEKYGGGLIYEERDTHERPVIVIVCKEKLTDKLLADISGVYRFYNENADEVWNPKF